MELVIAVLSGESGS